MERAASRRAGSFKWSSPRGCASPPPRVSILNINPLPGFSFWPHDIHRLSPPLSPSPRNSCDPTVKMAIGIALLGAGIFAREGLYSLSHTMHAQDHDVMSPISSHLLSTYLRYLTYYHLTSSHLYPSIIANNTMSNTLIITIKTHRTPPGHPRKPIPLLAESNLFEVPILSRGPRLFCIIFIPRSFLVAAGCVLLRPLLLLFFFLSS